MYDFTYHRPQSLDDARKLVQDDEFATLLAGGMTLLPTMKMRLLQTDDLVDLNGVTGLSGIRVEGDHVVIGAMTRHADVAASVELESRIPALASLARQIGDPQVRNRGTLGGSLANNDPAADYPAAVLGLGAIVQTDHRDIPADDYFEGMFETALEPGEIITAVRFPVPRRAAYAKFPNPASRYAVVGVFVAETGDGVRVAVTGAGPSVFRQADMERALAKRFDAAAIEGITVDAAELNGDLHASPEYRASLVTVMAKRAVAAASD